MNAEYKMLVRCGGDSGVRISCRRAIVMFDDFYTTRRGSKVSAAPSVPHASACFLSVLGGLLLGDMRYICRWTGCCTCWCLYL